MVFAFLLLQQTAVQSSILFCPAQLIGFYILGVQAAKWAVLHLISIPHRWQDSTDHVGCNNSCSPAFQNLMAEPAVSCEWILNSACFISDQQLWTLGCSSRSSKIRAKMRRLWRTCIIHILYIYFTSCIFPIDLYITSYKINKF